MQAIVNDQNIIFLQNLPSMHIYKNAYDYFNIFL